MITLRSHIRKKSTIYFDSKFTYSQCLWKTVSSWPYRFIIEYMECITNIFNFSCMFSVCCSCTNLSVNCFFFNCSVKAGLGRFVMDLLNFPLYQWYNDRWVYKGIVIFDKIKMFRLKRLHKVQKKLLLNPCTKCKMV